MIRTAEEHGTIDMTDYKSTGSYAPVVTTFAHGALEEKEENKFWKKITEDNWEVVETKYDRA